MSTLSPQCRRLSDNLKRDGLIRMALLWRWECRTGKRLYTAVSPYNGYTKRDSEAIYHYADLCANRYARMFGGK